MLITKNWWVLKKYRFTILFISWMMLVTSLSLFSLKGLHTSTIKIPHFDKIVHFTFYFFTTIFGSLSVKEINSKITLDKASNYMVVFAVIYGMIIEVLQYSFTENRQGDFFDFLANSLGAFIGWMIIKHLNFKRIF